MTKSIKGDLMGLIDSCNGAKEDEVGGLFLWDCFPGAGMELMG